MTVRIIDRCPVDRPTTFRIHEDEHDWEVDAEAVIARSVQLRPGHQGVRTRGSSAQPAGALRGLVVLGQEELQRCQSAAEESFQASELPAKKAAAVSAKGSKKRKRGVAGTKKVQEKKKGKKGKKSKKQKK
jgi:hypothetical protein